MSMIDLVSEKHALAQASRFGLPFLFSGFIYWTCLSIAGVFVSPFIWCIAAFIGSGLIFPVAKGMANVLHADILFRSVLGPAVAMAFLSMMLSWFITLACFTAERSLVPLCLAIGMCLHLPLIGWAYSTNIFLIHCLARCSGVFLLWYLFPSARFILPGAYVAVIYLLTAIVVIRKTEVASRENFPGQR